MANRDKTHCPKGHPYSGENLIVRFPGWRLCRICYTQAQARRYQRRKAAERATITQPTP